MIIHFIDSLLIVFHLEQHATGSVAFINLEHLLTRTHLNVLLLTTYDHPFALRFQ